jgi:multidrug efflux system membrane fusion protein
MRIRGIIIMLFIVALLSSCGKKEEGKAEKTPAIKEAAVEIVKPMVIEEYYEAVGTVRSKTTSLLSSKIVGNIISVHVREGDSIQKGQLLIEIDARDINAQFEKAQAGLREAQEALEEIGQTIGAAESARDAAQANKTLTGLTFKRYSGLLADHSVSQQEFDEVSARNRVAEAEFDRATRTIQSLTAKKNQVLAKVEQAKADVANAQVFLSYTRITSPISGIVTVKQADIGALAAPGVPLLTLEDNGHYRLEVTVEESQVKNIPVGMPAQVEIEAIGQQLLSRVTEVVPAADPATRSYIVKIDLPTAGKVGISWGLRSGLFGRARFAVGKRQAITVPQTSIVQRGQLVGLYAVDPDGVAHLRLIKTGKTYADRIEVLSGLNEGDRIVIDHVSEISDGARVRSKT